MNNKQTKKVSLNNTKLKLRLFMKVMGEVFIMVCLLSAHPIMPLWVALTRKVCQIGHLRQRGSSSWRRHICCCCHPWKLIFFLLSMT